MDLSEFLCDSDPPFTVLNNVTDTEMYLKSCTRKLPRHRILAALCTGQVEVSSERRKKVILSGRGVSLPCRVASLYSRQEN